VVLGPGQALHEVLCGGGLHVNASDAGIDVPGVLLKKGGDTATVTLELSRENASSGAQYHLTGWAAHPAGRIEAAAYITFTSGSTARQFVALLPEGRGRRPLAERLSGVRLCSIGPATSDVLLELGLPVAVEAAEHTAAGLVAAIAADARAAG